MYHKGKKTVVRLKYKANAVNAITRALLECEIFNLNATLDKR